MLGRLSGRTHQVLTAVALAGAAGLALRLSASEVRFRALSRAECQAYWDSGEPRDKAGGYAVQGPRRGLHRAPVAAATRASWGCRCYETAQLLAAAGIALWPAGAGDGGAA